jgi:AAA family ATP:ADP antiporter
MRSIIPSAAILFIACTNLIVPTYGAVNGNRHRFSTLERSSPDFAVPRCIACIPRGGANSKEQTANLQSMYPDVVKRFAKVTAVEEKKSSWFPIQKSELRQFVSMSVMMFLFIYVYTTVRDTKDTLVVSNCGAESIPFLKMWGVMPSAMVFIIVYSKLSQMLGKQALFYATLTPFFAFYTFFAFFLFPKRDAIHFVNSASNAGAAGAVNLLRYWSFSLYFIVSELWASAGVPLLFWQVANDITTVSQAQRFYPLFAVFGNLAPIASGRIMSFLVSRHSSDESGFGTTLKSLAVVKGASGLAIAVLYHMIYKEARRTAKEEEVQDFVNKVQKVIDIKKGGVEVMEVKFNMKRKAEPVKRKPTLRESVSELSKSKELRSIAIMVLGYNVCVELTEVLWKGILRKTHPTESSYMNFMASFSQKVGFIALVLQLTASIVIQKLGWINASQLTPLTMLALAVPFFLMVALSQRNPEVVPLSLALTIGTWQNVVNKVAKYSLFDPLKEMAYIPMGPDAKTKGKAAIDVLGARLGRSLAAASQQILVLATGNILECAPYLAGLYFGTITLWIQAVKVLGKMFDNEKPSDVEDATFGNVSIRTKRRKV